MKLLALLGRKPARLVAVVVGLALVVFVAVLATRSTETGTPAENPLVGHVAPPISGINQMDGKRVSLASERGHYVVVAFFASWCAPCATETPQLVDFVFAERKIHASVLGVTYNDSASNAVSFLRSYGATWPVVVDSSGTIAASYGVGDPPEAFLIGPSGKVLDWIPGGVKESVLAYIVNLGGTAS